MKPIQIGLLVVVGAIGGALVMKTMQRPKAPEVAQSQPSAPAAPVVQPVEAPAVTPAEAPLPPSPEVQKPSPVETSTRHKTSKKIPVVNVRVPVTQPRSNPPAPVQPEAAKPETAPEVAAAPVISPPPGPSRAEPENVTPAPRPPDPPHMVTLNAGMLLPVRLVDGLTTERNLPGDTFTASLDKELVMDGFVIAERGARVEGKVVASDRGGKVKGVSALAVELTRLRTSDGQNIAIQTDSFERHAEETHTQDAAKVGGGAALGAIIGAIAGGGKGAAVGAAAGGAAGAGGVLLTRGKEVRLPSETRINFRLSAPVTITERR